MTTTTVDKWMIRGLACSAIAIIALIPFHALLTVWLSQAFGHYTVLRLWKEVLLIPLAIGAACMLRKDAQLRHQVAGSKLTWLVVAYAAVQLIWGIAAHSLHQVNLTALGYGWISNTRFLVFFLVVWVIASKTRCLEANWQRLVFWPSLIVVAFGLMQYFVLPYDFLSHLGYGASTIFPYEDINNNTHYIRIMSTLRGANPLGAYLVLVLSLLVAVVQKGRSRWVMPLAASMLLALFLSFSRGAWLGLVASLAILAWLGTPRPLRKIIVAAVATTSVLAAGMTLALRGNPTFQNVILHTENHSAIKTTSNQGHTSALQNGLHDVIHQPFGRGPGTAGPASAYNTGHPVRLAENYFVQIAQETGWVGLALFVAINTVLAGMLWRRRNHPLALGLFAALIGLSVVNLFSHAWADDTLAYLWWGLAAVALTPAILQTKAEQHGPKKTPTNTTKRAN